MVLMVDETFHFLVKVYVVASLLNHLYNNTTKDLQKIILIYHIQRLQKKIQIILSEQSQSSPLISKEKTIRVMSAVDIYWILKNVMILFLREKKRFQNTSYMNYFFHLDSHKHTWRLPIILFEQLMTCSRLRIMLFLQEYDLLFAIISLENKISHILSVVDWGKINKTKVYFVETEVYRKMKYYFILWV